MATPPFQGGIKPQELHRSPFEMPNAFERHWRRLPFVLQFGREAANSFMCVFMIFPPYGGFLK